MGRPRMIWSKAAREKLEEELDLYLDVSLVIVKFERPNDVVRVAWDNITAVMKDLQDIISSKSSSVNDKQQQPQKDDVSLIINDCRSKVENQLQYICDNDVSHNNDKAFQDFVVHFKSQMQGPSNADDDTGTTKLKRKASQLTQLQLQQQKDDEDKLNVCLDKQDAVRQFTMDYHKTVRFMEKFVPSTKGPPVKDRLLIDAFLRIAKGYRYLYNIHGYDEEDKWYHLDVPHLINEYKSKLEAELQEICDKVSDPAIKEAFSHHLTEVTAQKDKDEQVLLAEDQAWMESSSDSDQEINANMVFMAQIEKVLSDFEASSSSADEKNSEVLYYLSESEFETSEYYDNSNFDLFVNNDDDQKKFHDAIESASENFIEKSY
nr:RNA-directed DNA polymerase, eukaryota, reverse transcriptase zinc-binding domain protein [Tanacetum cinerariifolium]